MKDLNIAETWSNYTLSYMNHYLSDVYLNEFTAWNAAYLHHTATREDLEIDYDDLNTPHRMSNNLMRGLVKTYA